jgi:hypothetical protein
MFRQDFLRNGFLLPLPWTFIAMRRHEYPFVCERIVPAVRVFIDFLAEHLPQQIEASRLDCGGKCSEAAERALELALDNARAGKVKKAS